MWLIALTGLSLILVLLERAKTSENGRAAKATSAVAGEKIINEDPLAKYRLLTSANFMYYQEMRFKKEAGQAQDYEIDSLKQALLATAVPAVYQDLHFQLTRLSEELAKIEADFLFLQEQESILVEKYPWLLQ